MRAASGLGGSYLPTGAAEKVVAKAKLLAAHLQKLGHEVLVQSQAGAAAGFSDAQYERAGVAVLPDAAAVGVTVERQRPAAPRPQEEETAGQRSPEA